ncbi:PLP-dependent aminotransferase family protein [Bacillus sp. NEB1478]|uniref:MocR-like pyridoxine biosynthesis transcription factor PdxR n=1 Tax=Bacillus sp. NEB1478 TaxID=3073816 RepID=UPI002873AAC8|nr:PLP-dependent aminotransferase family protein [Bacillus sp. NEB1478]WNB92756.1 PLP-dependent aminotransferase family protein [Bacillus sp. NEB1478]
MDLTPFLNRNSKIPLYQQLINFFKSNMHDGRIKNGIKLPSKRHLAKKLLISQTTVERAYDQLLAEGYILSKPRSGLFADYDESFLINPDPKPAELPVQDFNVITNKIIDFHYGHVDSSFFPFSAWRKNVVASLDKYSEKLCRPGDVLGEIELRSLITEYLYQSRGVNCDPNQIIIGASTSYLLQILCHILNTSLKVGFEEPGYPRSREIFELNRKEIIHLPLDSEGLKMYAVKKNNPDLIYITPSHQYPLGRMMTINRRLELLKWAADNHSFIIEDDYDGEFRYSGQPIPSLQALDKENRVVYLGTFSNSFLPTLRISYMILPQSLLKKATQVTSLFKQTVSSINQFALAEFIQNGEWQKHLNRMRKLYRKKRNIILEAVIRELGDKVKIHGENSGPRILIDVYLELSEKDLIQKAESHGVRVYPVSDSYKKGYAFNTISLGFSGVSEEEIKRGIYLLSESWDLK